MNMAKRIIGRYKGNKPGPLIVLTGAMHGNEHAGVRAIDILLKTLEAEQASHPEFEFHGNILGLIGNTRAYEKGMRYIHEDINRFWFEHYIHRIKQAHIEDLKDEDLEMREFIETLDSEIEALQPTKIYLMDLHTTSSDGIFSIGGSSSESIEIASNIPVSIVINLIQGLGGTTLNYFGHRYNGIPSTALAFEGGYHFDPISANRCLSAAIFFLRYIGAIKEDDLENTNNFVLKQYGKDLPKKMRVIYRHQVDDPTLWEMQPGFKNFDIIYQGQLLAHYDKKTIHAPESGYILMPLYQKQGHDGFFICVEDQ